MGRRKKTEIPEEVSEESSEEKPYPPKEHHWSDDGPRYCVMMELDDGYPGCRHYGAFFETEDLVLAKHECLAQFEECNKCCLIMDRAERSKEIVRHEVEVKELKDGDKPVCTPEPKSVRTKPTTKAKRRSNKTS